MHYREVVEQNLINSGEQAPMGLHGPLQPSHHRDLALSNILYSQDRKSLAAAASDIPAVQHPTSSISFSSQTLTTLYTPEQRRRRDATKWTLVQGILAPVQFAIFLVSVALVIRYLATDEGFAIATASIVVKTLALYVIMITGAIWEREVFGVYLFAPAFYWEDVFSFLVLALHTAYLAALLFSIGDPRDQMLLALAAYATYVVNATQFVLKLRAARRDESLMLASQSASAGRTA